MEAAKLISDMSHWELAKLLSRITGSEARSIEHGGGCMARPVKASEVAVAMCFVSYVQLSTEKLREIAFEYAKTKFPGQETVVRFMVLEE